MLKKTFARSRTMMLDEGWTCIKAQTETFRLTTTKPAAWTLCRTRMDTETMKSYKKILAAAIMFLGSSSSAHSEAGWTNSGYLQEVQATTSGVLIAKGKLGGNPSGCKDGDLYYADYSTKGTEKIFPLLLQAISTKNRVKFFVTGRCDLNGMSEISAATIHAE